MKRTLILVIACALVAGGCGGEPRDLASSVRRPVAAGHSTGRADQCSECKIELVLSSYGKRLIGMHDRDWRNMVVYPPGVAPGIKWFSHFGLLLELDAEAWNGTEIFSMSRREVRAAMVDYITEKIYPVSMGLSIMREGRRLLLGDYVDSYMQDLEVHRSGGGFELIYKKDF